MGYTNTIKFVLYSIYDERRTIFGLQIDSSSNFANYVKLYFSTRLKFQFIASSFSKMNEVVLVHLTTQNTYSAKYLESPSPVHCTMLNDIFIEWITAIIFSFYVNRRLISWSTPSPFPTSTRPQSRSDVSCNVVYSGKLVANYWYRYAVTIKLVQFSIESY